MDQFCENSWRLLAVKYFLKKMLFMDVQQGPKYTSAGELQAMLFWMFLEYS